MYICALWQAVEEVEKERAEAAPKGDEGTLC
jgi:hypothetical protein